MTAYKGQIDPGPGPRSGPKSSGDSYRNWQISAAILLIAFSVRIAIMLGTRSYLVREQGEIVRIAESLAEGHGFANAYGDTGPTAHSSPIYPLALSVVYRWFGTGVRGELAQEVFNCFVAALVWGLMPVLGAVCRLRRRVAVTAALLGALLPLNRWAETKGSSEGAMAGLACVVVFLLYMRFWYARSFSVVTGIAAGVVSGLSILISASLGAVIVGLLLCGFVLFRSSLTWRYLRFGIAASITIFAMLLPWALRNRFVLGHLVWTRSNLPLELRVSNNDDARPTLRENERFWVRYHPSVSAAERADVKRMGELAYQEKLRTDVLRWIASHPGRFISLTTQRVCYFWFPSMARPTQTLLLGLFTITSIPGLIFLMQKKQLLAYALSTTLLLYPLVYYFVQAHPRYVYPIQWALYLLGMQGVMIASQLWRVRRGSDS
jgi:hypothetical protein